MKQLIDEKHDENEENIPDRTLIVMDNEMADETTKLASAMRKPTRGKRMLQELATSYSDINDLRVTGDTDVNSVTITRSKAPTHFVVPNENTLMNTEYDSKNEGGDDIVQFYHFCYNTAVQSDPGEPKSPSI